MEKLITNWKLAWVENKRYLNENVSITTVQDVKKCGYKSINATVPGNFELDFMREGILPDVYVGANSVETQKFENLHLFYYAEFNYERKDGVNALLTFEGVDTVAEIYLDGEKLGFVENMHHSHSFDINALKDGKHEVLLHILPVCNYARQFDIPAMCFGMKYNHDSIEIRKSASMFGWDIMPRIVSAGLWKPVKIEYVKKARIKEPFVYTNWMSEDKSVAILVATFKIESEEDFISNYRVLIKGKCRGGEFNREWRPFNASNKVEIEVKNPYLWWPKNYGEQNLYEVEFTLLYNGVECDKITVNTGIRQVWLKRTSRSGDDGDFCFIVNGKRVFVMGTNWVPCDAFPSRHDEYTLRNLEYANDLGCNMIRCWGGNTYPSEIFYDYCDKNGIMVWQDFTFGCGHYPDDDRLCALTKEEVKRVAIEKRNHPSLVLWAGDNECDCFVVNGWETDRTDDDPTSFLNPNYNKITRDVILKELRNHDATRPYLPSSPYIDELTYRYGMPSESHIWGPRDFFKGQYYATTRCHFASEIGYHGCPSPKSINKFITPQNLPYKSITDIYNNAEWLIHASGIEPYAKDNPYAYRLPLMVSQVERIFGSASNDLSEFARQSQISQAEAKKFFIEMFRLQRPRKTGILWWNVVDGWPQVSDAIIDWYGVKKLAYSYVKRSQAPLCFMMSEPKDGKLSLVVTNDSRQDETGSYEVVDITTDKVVAHGNYTVESDGKLTVDVINENKEAFYLIKWTYSGGTGVNHFTANIGENWTYEKYKTCMQKAGFYDEFEGF
ncbi:MAG: hypothetical protein E7360_05175 [Clostridiales bacterium]|nr:hypothetical protein [Clostridiales bacterium]